MQVLFPVCGLGGLGQISYINYVKGTKWGPPQYLCCLIPRDAHLLQDTPAKAIFSVEFDFDFAINFDLYLEFVFCFDFDFFFDFDFCFDFDFRSL